MWDLFLDWHEFLPHTLFEVLTAVPPIILGWIFGHRKHDARRHQRVGVNYYPFRDLREVSILKQRIERLEAEARRRGVPSTWDNEGLAGL